MRHLAINALIACGLALALVFAGGILAWGYYSPRVVHYVSLALVLPFVIAAKSGASGAAGNILAYAIYFAVSFALVSIVRRPRKPTGSTHAQRLE